MTRHFAVALAIAKILSAQSFEVASIKPSVGRPAEGGRSRIEHSPGSVTMRNVSLTDCIMWAYRVELYQISEQGSRDQGNYDILAKAPAPVPVNQLRQMVQQLLAERFKLSLHRDTKTLAVYALTVAKGGPKLPAANADEGHHAVELLPRIKDGESFLFLDSSLPEFAAKLSLLRTIDRPVVDQTGIDGYFDITLKGAAQAILQPDGPSLFTLVQEQLGLKLVATKAPVQILVIDHVEKPSGN